MLSVFILYKPTPKYHFCWWKVLLKLGTHKHIFKLKRLQIHFSCSINQSINQSNLKWPSLKPTFWQRNMDQYLTQPFHWSQCKFSQHLMCVTCKKIPFYVISYQPLNDLKWRYLFFSHVPCTYTEGGKKAAGFQRLCLHIPSKCILFSREQSTE